MLKIKGLPYSTWRQYRIPWQSWRPRSESPTSCAFSRPWQAAGPA